MKIESPITPIETKQDEGNISLRPQSLDNFIGQQQLRENLKVFVNAAKKRKTALDHIILFGPPGLGKTTIAAIVAKEMQTNFKATSGPLLSKAGDLAAILSNLSKGDVLFIDEIHRMNSAVEEILYSAMEDFKLDLIIGEGPAARTVRIDLPKFTLIGATTRMGLISGPLRDRFGIQLRLNFYSIIELKEVITRASIKLSENLDESGATEIAKRSRGTPRIALRLLKRVCDFSLVTNCKIIAKEIANQALNNLEIDEYGLDAQDRQYLRYIAENYNGGPIGIDTLAAGLSEQKDTIEETIEPYLLQQGFIGKTPRGRVLTEKALQHLQVELELALES